MNFRKSHFLIKKKAYNFYNKLPNIGKVSDFFKQQKHETVPSDWYVVVTDVVDSTKAIEAGQYKDVNTVGALTVMAISNVFNSLKFPFVFGGDGAVCLIPFEMVSEVGDVLFDTKLKVKNLFDLDLRVGLVPVKTLYEAGKELYISKIKVSPYYSQAVLDGNGIYFAEHLIKQDAANNKYLIYKKTDPNKKADFTGFSCRWEEVPSSKEETIATVLKIRNYADRDNMMQEILAKIKSIFGETIDFHPISTEHLKIAHSGNSHNNEARVFSNKTKGLAYLVKLVQIKIEAFITQLAMTYNLPIKFQWYHLNLLKQYQVLSSDFFKYDGSLKTVISCNTSAREEWEIYLKELKDRGDIFYGIHISHSAVITCLLQANSQQEVHFIDGSNGGYALAAKRMKIQMSEDFNDMRSLATN